MRCRERRMAYGLTALILVAACLASHFSYAANGNEGGGGGIDVELEFAEIAYLFTDTLTKSRQSLPDFADLDLNAFLSAQATTEVYAVETLCTNIQDENGSGSGLRCLDAAYFPDRKQIRFSTESWTKKDCLRKMGIVVHELGRAAGVENGNYKYSARVRRSDLLRRACIAYEQEMKDRSGR